MGRGPSSWLAGWVGVLLTGCGGRALEPSPLEVPAAPPDASAAQAPDGAILVTQGDAGAKAAADADVPAESRTGVAIRTCGGNDALSILVRVAAKGGPPLACGLARPDASFDEIFPWFSLAVGPIPFSIPGTGAAASCEAGACTDAVSATLTVTSITPASKAALLPSAVGSYTMVLPDGTMRASAFVVVVCDEFLGGPCG